MTNGVSVFPERPGDASACVFTPEAFGACPDGQGDNTAALQKAVDEIVERNTHGILFVPPGRYCFRGTVQLWRGIRLIGFGPRRPVFLLEDHSPGFGGPERKYILHFRDMKPQPGYPLRDGQNTSFYGGRNPGLTSVEWLAAPDSVLEDILFLHAGHVPVGRREKNTGGQSVAPPPARKGKDRLHTLWIHDGGAGVFKNIWSPDVWAEEGFSSAIPMLPAGWFLSPWNTMLRVR